MSIQLNRKRMRSDDEIVPQQSKYFINEKLIDLHDDDKMKQIYQKTVDLLYKGAKNNKNNQNINITNKEQCKELTLTGNGTLGLKINNKKPSWITDNKLCNCCNKLAMIHVDCNNCNLELCEFCGFSCTDCRLPICSACICLFNCGTVEKPYCQQCKLYSFN